MSKFTSEQKNVFKETLCKYASIYEERSMDPNPESIDEEQVLVKSAKAHSGLNIILKGVNLD